MIQRRTRDYEVSLWSLQDSFIAILKQYGLEFKGQIENGKLTDRDDGTQTFSFIIPMYYYKNGEKIPNPSWYNVESGALLTNMRKIKVIFNKDNQNRKIYQFLIVKVKEKHDSDNSLYCEVECEGLAFHELGKIGYKIGLSSQDFYNDDYDWATNGQWIDGYGNVQTTEPLATLNYWNDKIFSTISNWQYKIQMNWNNHSLSRTESEGVLEDYTTENDVLIQMNKRASNKVYEQDFIDAWNLKDGKLVPSHITYAREKARISIDISDSNIYNITQSLAQTFGVFCKYVYEHDETGHIIGRTVVYYNNFLNEQNGLSDITYPYQTNSINRSLDSTDLVTKLYVKSIDDESGTLSIIDVGANKSQEDYILNFDYLYKIGGITKEQYDAVEEYLLKIRSINEKITPVAAKVIFLQSQLVKLEADLTTCKNSIALDMEQKLNNEALLKAITNGSEVLSVSKDHPQTAVLLKDTGEGTDNTYYVKITQKGVYPETIKLYRTYSYQTSTLSDEIKTGLIQFDDAGEVIRISNIYYDDSNISKTVYITYDYRPKLYYDRIVNMWINKLAEDEARRDSLQQELARIKYSLYGLSVKEDLRNINVANLFDVDVEKKYKDLLKEKADTIKEFNALMGPALREGYWQPEDYTDYGDQYNERFTIKLSELDPIPGSTGNSYFKWDDELFEGEQDIYYEYTAAQYEQAYPCIDLSKHPDILKMIVENRQPISFVYKPITSNQDNPYPRRRPSTSNNNVSQIVVIPNLYLWDNNNDGTVHLNINNLPQDYQTFLMSDNKLNAYDGTLLYSIDPERKQEYSYYVWYAKTSENGQWFNITQSIEPYSINNNTDKYIFQNIDTYKNNIRLLDKTSLSSSTIQVISTSNQKLYDWIIRLVAGNQLGTNIEYDENNNESNIVDSTHIRALTDSNITYNSDIAQEQTVIKNNANHILQFSYNVSNTHLTDMNTNHYIWQISNEQNFNNAITIIDYYEGKENEPHIHSNYQNKIVINKEESNGIFTHTLQINNINGTFFETLFQDSSTKYVRLIIKNLNHYLNNSAGTIGKSFICYGRDTAPWIIPTTDEETILAVEYPTQKVFKLILTSEVALSSLNNNLAAEWQINANGSSDWQDINTYFNNMTGGNNITISNTTNKKSNSQVQSKAILLLTISDNADIGVINNLLNGKFIRGRIGSNINGYSDWYKFTTALQFVTPMEVIDANELLSPSVILLKSEGDNGQQYNEHTITVQINHALEYTWTILPVGASTPITLTVNSNNINANTEDSRYFAKFMSDRTILTIRIPLIADTVNNLRDNGTRIKCVCKNFTVNTVSIPETDYTTLRVTYPLIIESISDCQWWAIAREESIKVGTIMFSISKALIGEQNIANIINSNQIIANCNSGAIELISDTSKNITLNSQNILFDITNINYEEINGNIRFSADLCFGLSNIDNLVINSNNIINTNNTNNDRLYQVKLNYSLIFQPNVNDDTLLIMSQEQIASIIIRQNIPEYVNNNYIANITGAEPEYNTSNTIRWTYEYENATLTEPIEIYANDSRIFSLNLSSISPGQIIWKCGRTGNTTVSGLPVHSIPFIPITGNVLTCNNKQAVYTKTDAKNGVTNVTDIGIFDSSIVSSGNSLSRGLGLSEHLYLYASNPWGQVCSQYFLFPAMTE